MPENANPAETRLGKGMLYVGWCLVLIVLAFMFSGFETSKHNPNQDIGNLSSSDAEVILQRNSYGHYVFTGYANNQSVDFLLDTGASHVVFTESQAERLGLKKGIRVRINTANGETWSYSTRVEKLEIGPITLYDVVATINPHMDTEALLGMSALGELEWSQRGDQLTIRQP